MLSVRDPQVLARHGLVAKHLKSSDWQQNGTYHKKTTTTTATPHTTHTLTFEACL